MKIIWLLKALLAFNCALVAWELILSQSYVSKPLSQNHPLLGRMEGRGTYVQGKEGYARTKLNELGMRSPSLTPKKLGEKRILVLGDSYTMAMQVADEETFTNQLANRLAKEISNVNVINCGGEGGAPSDYIIISDFYRQTYQPDLVVIQLNEGDFTTDPFDSNRRSFFEKTGTGYKIKTNDSWVSQNHLVSQYALLQKYLNFSVARVAAEHLSSTQKQTELTSPQSEKSYLSTLVPFTIATLKQKYGDPILIFIPQIDYFSNQIDRLTPTEVLVAKAAKQQGLKLVSMRQDYVKQYRETHQTAHGFNNTEPGMGHINALGHELVARRLHDAIYDREKKSARP